SFHSPVRKVNYFVEDARLGQTTDYDKLTVEIWTNGTCLPQDALSMAAKLLSEQLTIFVNFEEKEETVDVDRTEQNEWIMENLNRSIEELDLSVRAQNCLRNEDVKTIGDLVLKSEAEMLTLKNFGRKSLHEIKEILESMGLRLGMKAEELTK
ncbi:DNA-directed RNA polymerase subunit alpha C-terminal domain-containing protein, partial [Acidobacteriota bacterium]